MTRLADDADLSSVEAGLSVPDYPAGALPVTAEDLAVPRDDFGFPSPLLPQPAPARTYTHT